MSGVTGLVTDLAPSALECIDERAHVIGHFHGPSASRISSGVTHGATGRDGRVAAYSSIASVAASQAKRQASARRSNAESGAWTNKTVRRGESSAPSGGRRSGSHHPMLHPQRGRVLYDRLVVNAVSVESRAPQRFDSAHATFDRRLSRPRTGSHTDRE